MNITTTHLNLDRLPAGALPGFHPSKIGGEPMLYARIGDTTIWLRVDQVNELAAKLLCHLPSEKNPKEAA